MNAEKKIIFKINKKELKADKVLVDYNSFPIFFVCKDNDEQYYICLCKNDETGEYIISTTKPIDLISLINKEITAKELIMKPTNYWDVKVRENVDSDIVIMKNMSEILPEELPTDDSYLEFSYNMDMDDYESELRRKL